MLHIPYIRNVVVATAILVVFLTGCQANPIRQEGEVFCDPAKHQYYMPQIQGCTDCDKCWSGKEPDLQGADLGMGLHGATKCPLCRICSQGTYNPGGDRYWNCLSCTVCSDSGMIEVESCTATQDTKCSNTVTQVQKRLISTSPEPYGNVQARQKHEGEETHTAKVTYALMTAVVIGVGALVAYVIYDQRKRLRRTCMGNPITSEIEESIPLHTGQMEPTYPDSCNFEEEGGPGEADDHLGSIRDIRTNERAPLIPKRNRHQSCGYEYEYKCLSYRLDKQVGQAEKETCERRIPAIQRQLSHPVTNTEVGNTEQQLDKRRPKKRFISFLSKLLAPNEQYKDFAQKMGLETYKIKLLEEEKRERTLTTEDISYEYTTRALRCKPKLSYHDIYDALTDLGLVEECAILQEKRKCCILVGLDSTWNDNQAPPLLE